MTSYPKSEEVRNNNAEVDSILRPAQILVPLRKHISRCGIVVSRVPLCRVTSATKLLAPISRDVPKLRGNVYMYVYVQGSGPS